MTTRNASHDRRPGRTSSRSRKEPGSQVDRFLNPPALYRPVPFWSLNERLERFG